MQNASFLKRLLDKLTDTIQGRETRNEGAAREFLERLAELGLRLSIYTFEGSGRAKPFLAFNEQGARTTLKTELGKSRSTQSPVSGEDYFLAKIEPVTVTWLASNFDHHFFLTSLLNIEGDLVDRATEGGIYNVKVSSVDHLCKAVGIPYAPTKEIVHLGHGGGHCNLTTDKAHAFYVDLDLLRGKTKEARMQNALEVLASDLGSKDAIHSLRESGVINNEPGALRWPLEKEHPVDSPPRHSRGR